MEYTADRVFPLAQIFVVLAVLLNIILLYNYKKQVGAYRGALASPVYHWLFHVLLFYLVTIPVRYMYHPLSSVDDILTYWSLVLRLHGQIAVGVTILGIAGREGSWKRLLPIPRWRS